MFFYISHGLIVFYHISVLQPPIHLLLLMFLFTISLMMQWILWSGPILYHGRFLRTRIVTDRVLTHQIARFRMRSSKVRLSKSSLPKPKGRDAVLKYKTGINLIYLFTHSLTHNPLHTH